MLCATAFCRCYYRSQWHAEWWPQYTHGVMQEQTLSVRVHAACGSWQARVLGWHTSCSAVDSELQAVFQDHPEFAVGCGPSPELLTAAGTGCGAGSISVVLDLLPPASASTWASVLMGCSSCTVTSHVVSAVARWPSLSSLMSSETSSASSRSSRSTSSSRTSSSSSSGSPLVPSTGSKAWTGGSAEAISCAELAVPRGDGYDQQTEQLVGGLSAVRASRP
jgi:hypothetical protein